MRRIPSTLRAGLALLATIGLVLGLAPSATAVPPVAPKSYEGPTYTSQIARPPTVEGNQSKLWFHAGAWWALMVEPTGRVVRVFQLLPDHTWRPTAAVVNADAFDAGDAVTDGANVHVVTRRSNGWLTYVRLTFDPAAGDYTAGPSVLVTDKGLRAPGDIAKDTTGRLWISLDTAAGLNVTTSGDGGQTWSDANTLAGISSSSNAESAAMIAYDDKVGVLWSDPLSGSFQFAWHQDGADPFTWTRETARSGTRLGAHTSLKRVDGENGDILAAAVTLVPPDVGAAPETLMIEVLVRTPDGRWTSTPVSTVADQLDEPALLVDATTRTLRLFAAQDDDIVVKEASVEDFRFEPGPGRVFLQGEVGRLFSPSVSKDPVTARTGMVVLASDQGALTYRHAEAPVLATEPVLDSGDTTAPAPPPIVRGRAQNPESVVLSWAEAVDSGRWAPARNGVPAAEYVVLRYGEEIATVTSTVFEDRPRGNFPAANSLSVDYQVIAVDQNGNRSEPRPVTVELPAASPEGNPSLVGWGLLALALGCGALAVRRPLQRVRANRAVTGVAPSPAVEERTPEHSVR